MHKTIRQLADGREIIYFDEGADPPRRDAVDTRELPFDTRVTQRRLDPLTNEWVVIADHRQTRTDHSSAQACPLCPTRSGPPSEIPEPDYDVVVLQNRFPALSGGDGRSEVVCFTSDHNSSFVELGPQRVRTVVDVLAERTGELSALPGVEHVFPFENRGTEIGVTLHHPHGQIYGYPFVPPRVDRMLDTARTYGNEHGRHLLGDVLDSERQAGVRVVAESEHWTAFVPQAARWPVQILIVPHRRRADLTELSPAERDDFAHLYPRVLRLCDRLFERPLPYVAAWQQAPVHRDRDRAWLHLELFSVRRAADKLKYLAGSESGMSVWVNDVVPETMADRLRNADTIHG